MLLGAAWDVGAGEGREEGSEEGNTRLREGWCQHTVETAGKGRSWRFVRGCCAGRGAPRAWARGCHAAYTKL